MGFTVPKRPFGPLTLVKTLVAEINIRVGPPAAGRLKSVCRIIKGRGRTYTLVEVAAAPRKQDTVTLIG